MNAKAALLFLLPAAIECGCGRPDHVANAISNAHELIHFSADAGRGTNLIAVGNWSEPVKDPAGYILRGRLLVFAGSHYFQEFGNHQEIWGDPAVYLELQDLSSPHDQPMEVYFDPEIYISAECDLECELRDAHGKPIPSPRMPFNGPIRTGWWITVPPGGSVRLRAGYGPGSGTISKPTSFTLSLNQYWSIPTGDTNDYFLSGTFSPPIHHPSPPDVHVWSGTLALPRMQIVPQVP